MPSASKRLVVVSLMVAAVLLAPSAAAAACRGTLYLTIDTGNMRPAEEIAAILRKHQIKATFFVASEPTYRGDRSLDLTWTNYWRARVAEGHAFGNHTWQHAYFRGDLPDGRMKYVHSSGKTELLDQAGVCAEMKQVQDRFRDMTGRSLDPIWRAPGGRTTPAALAAAKRCGYDHVHWADAGFLGDELPSEKFPNALLLDRALTNLRNGDIMVMHLGIWSRNEPFWHVLDPLLAGLREKGFCFATLPKKE